MHPYWGGQSIIVIQPVRGDLGKYKGMQIDVSEKFIMKKKGSRKNGYKELPDEKLYKVYKLVNVGASRVRYRWT